MSFLVIKGLKDSLETEIDVLDTLSGFSNKQTATEDVLKDVIAD